MMKTNTHYCMRIPSHTDNLEIIRNFVSTVAKKVGFDDSEIGKIELSVDEACTNVIEHAYRHKDGQKIDVAIKIDYNKFTVIITDRGRAFDFKAVEMPDMKTYLAELRVGGLGIYLMKTLMDKVEYHSTPGKKNEVRMVKYFLKKNGSSCEAAS
jgi:serine/threonine-protein kinase RsbW